MGMYVYIHMHFEIVSSNGFDLINHWKPLYVF